MEYIYECVKCLHVQAKRQFWSEKGIIFPGSVEQRENGDV